MKSLFFILASVLFLNGCAFAGKSGPADAGGNIENTSEPKSAENSTADEKPATENMPVKADSGKVGSSDEEPPKTPEPAGEPNESETGGGEKIESVYTDLADNKCKTLESNPDEGGSYRGECPGVGGYRLEVLEGDLRQSINVVAPDGKKFELDFWTISVGFSAVGEKAEWRVVKNGKTVKPIALIVRFNVSENPEKPEKNTSYLIVSKITDKIACVTDVVKPAPNANETARKSADASGGKACRNR